MNTIDSAHEILIMLEGELHYKCLFCNPQENYETYFSYSNNVIIE